MGDDSIDSLGLDGTEEFSITGITEAPLSQRASFQGQYLLCTGPFFVWARPRRIMVPIAVVMCVPTRTRAKPQYAHMRISFSLLP